MSFAAVFAALTVVEGKCADNVAAAGHERPRVYQYRPSGAVEVPAIYNVLEPSRMAPTDTVADRDELIIGCRVAIRHGDSDEEFSKLLAVADIVRSTLDRGLKDNANPLGAYQARRLGVHLATDVFGEIPVLAFEFPIRVRMDTLNAPLY